LAKLKIKKQDSSLFRDGQFRLCDTQLTAIPRSFFSPIVAMRLNDISQIISFPILVAAFLLYFKPRNGSYCDLFLKIHILFSFLAGSSLFLFSERSYTYIAYLGGWLLFLGGIPCFMAGC